jgi:class 3 adenylate cyclase
VRAREAEALTGVELIVFSPIVTDSNRAGWEEYAWTHQNWIDEDISYHPDYTVHPGTRWNGRGPLYQRRYVPFLLTSFVSLTGEITKRIYRYSEEMDHAADERRMRELTDYQEELYVPVWQLGPVPRNASIVNLDLLTHPSFKHLVTEALHVERSLLSDVANLGFLHNQYGANHDHLPRSYALIPIMNDFDEAAEVVGFITGELSWTTFFQDVLPSEVKGIVLEVVGSCGESFTFQVNGHQAAFLGYGFEHSAQFDNLFHSVAFAKAETEVNETAACEYTLTFFPTSEFEAVYVTNKPAVYTCVVVFTFVFTAMTFALYDFAIARRQKKLLRKAKQSTAIVASMFPKDVQKRILEEAEAMEEENVTKKWRSRGAAKQQLKTFLLENDAGGSQPAAPATKPIADFFTETTVAFMDIAGFTAWSSVRDASQVFLLLESVFHKFDSVAQQRRVFKVHDASACATLCIVDTFVCLNTPSDVSFQVETVGDCYVAVSGLPEPRMDHALVMARFARDCLYGFNVLVKQLETTLGPETGELGLRVGLHTGPVTAGVLRGERARFQLFGDTMNTCARIESLGVRNKIHMSQETADRITSHGKGHWCRPREDAVIAKGKGELKTFWLELKGDSALSSRSGASCSTASDQSSSGVALTLLGSPANEAESGQVRSASIKSHQNRIQSLVSWNVAVLTKVLREVVARREASGIESTPSNVMKELERRNLTRNETVLEEFKEVVSLPKFDAEAAKRQRDESAVELGENVVDQLHEYLNVIATMYRENAFHNCEHASHVAMSVVKLLSRIVAPETLESTTAENSAKDLHDHTYGITSDPLTQFAVIIAALIHDGKLGDWEPLNRVASLLLPSRISQSQPFSFPVDHTGVPNAQLIKEQATVATVYKNKSVAEQNSVDIGAYMSSLVVLRLCLQMHLTMLLPLSPSQHGSFLWRTGSKICGE